MSKVCNVPLKNTRVQFYTSLFKQLLELDCVKKFGTLNKVELKTDELVCNKEGLSIMMGFVKGSSLNPQLNQENPTYVLFLPYIGKDIFVCFKDGDKVLKGEIWTFSRLYYEIIRSMKTVLSIIEKELDNIPEDISHLCLKLNNSTSSPIRVYNPETSTVKCEVQLFKNTEV